MLFFKRNSYNTELIAAVTICIRFVKKNKPVKTPALMEEGLMKSHP